VTPIEPLPEVPEYLHAPHPVGFDFADLELIFHKASSPTPEKLAGCNEKFESLKVVTQKNEDIYRVTREFIKNEPVEFHWCFYHKIFTLHETLKNTPTWRGRQKEVIEAFEFLVPVARGFRKEFHDPRYLRWASRYYIQLSKTVFYKNLVLSPQAVSDQYGEISTPYALWKKSEPQKEASQAEIKNVEIQSNTNLKEPKEELRVPAGLEDQIDAELETELSSDPFLNEALPELDSNKSAEVIEK
tara:strand:+ start:2364 stop:3095 length:732 start_codon:yes stop_codon:yes gene_type:complete